MRQASDTMVSLGIFEAHTFRFWTITEKKTKNVQIRPEVVWQKLINVPKAKKRVSKT
jgi:hypothetical protein